MENIFPYISSCSSTNLMGNSLISRPSNYEGIVQYKELLSSITANMLDNEETSVMLKFELLIVMSHLCVSSLENHAKIL